MPYPAKLIQVLAEQTGAENLDCPACAGRGEVACFDPETGSAWVECDACVGSGYNQLGLILRHILKPPPEGYGSVALREALQSAGETQALESLMREARQLVEQAERDIEQLQAVIAASRDLLQAVPLRASHGAEPPPPRRRIS